MTKGYADKTKALLIKELEEPHQQVTDLNNSESIAHKLEASELRYRRLFEAAQDGILILDTVTAQIVDVNPFLVEMLGYSKEEFLGKRLWEVGAFKNIESAKSAFAKLQSEHHIRYEDMPLEAKNGRLINVEFVSNVYDVDHTSVIQCNIRDITERKRAEKHMLHLNSVLRALRNVNQLITHEKDKGHLIQRSCDLLIEARGFAKAWILLLDDKGSFASMASAGLGEESKPFLEQLKAGNYPECMKELWAQEAPILAYDRPGRQHEGCVLARSHSNLGVFRCKLQYEGRIYGVMGVSVPYQVSMDEEEHGLFLELCNDISYALASIREEEKRKQAEEQTRRLEEYLQLQVDRMPIALIVWDTDFRAQSWNPSAEKTFGFTREEAVGKHPYDIIVPSEAQPQVDSIWRRLLEGDTTAHSTNENITKDSRTIICRWSNTPLKKADGTVVGVLSMVEDITAQKQAEEALIQSEEKCKAIFDSATDGILIADPETKKFFAANRTICEILGYSQEEIKNIGVMDIHPEGEVSQIVEKFEKQTEGEVELVLDIPVKRRDGSVFYADINSAPVTFAGKTYLMGMFRDATERRKAEDVLRTSEEKLRLMFKSVTDGITVTDLNGAITEVNERMVEMHGFSSKDDLLGKSPFELIAAGDHERAKMNMRKTLEQGSVKYIEYTLLKADGCEFPGELSSSVLKDATGTPVGFIAITRDITERRRMEEQLIMTDRLASIGELASGMAHELNNPLTGVIGLSQLLLDRVTDEGVKEDLKLVCSEAQRAANVVKHLLTFARKHPAAKQLVSVHRIIEKMLELRAYEQRVSNIEVITRFAPNLPEIMADDFQLQQVFLNIIINAEYFMIQAHNKGTLTINTEKVDSIVRASFSDDGPGIAKENLGHLFDPFFTTKEVGKGTGLGLSICHGIVTAHGGRIFAESKLGKGATFVIELPLGDGEGTE